ncbi:MAG: glycosyltransferase family 2 protein [Candidatus Hydrogenedentes bacterium]|nr:glycosyltransferase family 2 protein [Candidatus Hydrogenedentota bacterium]
MSTPFVHVLVINWNGREHLEACFESLIKQTYENLRIVLLDNASTDGSVEYVQERFGSDPRVEILECGENLGWSRANNVGMERALGAGADYIFLLNNDTSTAPDAVERLVEFARVHPKAGAIAPKMLLFDQPWLINSVGIACTIVGGAWDEGLGRVDGPRWAEPKQVLGVCGGAMFLRADALRAVGLLPGDFEIYLDDLDLCLRIWDAGYECWSCPSAAVRHKFSATMGEGARAHRKYYLNTRNRARLMLRNFPSGRFVGIVAHYAVSEIRAVGRAAASGAVWKAVAHVRSWIAALAYVPKAVRHRRSVAAKSRAIGTFWGLVRADRHFFPGIELPKRGWYTPIQRDWTAQGHSEDVQVHPISSCATADVPAGELSVTHANCYPQLGATRIELRLNGRAIAALRSDGSPRTERFETEGGTLEFFARAIFEAESTGERYDIGGWVALDKPNTQ